MQGGALAFQHRTGREDFHVLHGGHRVGIIGHAIADPFTQYFVFRAAGFHQFPAGVRHAVDGFGDQETVLGDSKIDTAATHFLRQAVVVSLGVKSKQGETEAVLTPGGAVAGTGVAAIAHEDRHHIEGEADRTVLGGGFDGHGNIQGLSFPGHRHGGGAVLEWSQTAALECGEGWVCQGNGGLGGNVNGNVIGAGGHGHEGVEVSRAFQGDLVRINRKRPDGGSPCGTGGEGEQTEGTEG